MVDRMNDGGLHFVQNANRGPSNGRLRVSQTTRLVEELQSLSLQYIKYSIKLLLMLH